MSAQQKAISTLAFAVAEYANRKGQEWRTGEGTEIMDALQAVNETCEISLTTYWVRTCQECGWKQTDSPQEGEPSDDYRSRKCRRCKSEALDYGSDMDEAPPTLQQLRRRN